MKWLYESKFYKWLDADKTGRRWETYGTIILFGSIVAYGLILWVLGLAG
jgi:hypothetical protein